MSEEIKNSDLKKQWVEEGEPRGWNDVIEMLERRFGTTRRFNPQHTPDLDHALHIAQTLGDVKHRSRVAKWTFRHGNALVGGHFEGTWVQFDDGINMVVMTASGVPAVIKGGAARALLQSYGECFYIGTGRDQREILARSVGVEQKENCYRTAAPWTNFTSIDLGNGVALLNGAPVKIRKEHHDSKGGNDGSNYDPNRFRLVVSPLRVVYKP